MSDSWVVDQEYLAVLERKLKVLKDPKKTTAKQVVSDIAARKEHQVGLDLVYQTLRRFPP